ncbi:aldo/keto reductase [Streptomyces sp. NPDC056661]|uniref:aldo/keto reductase n=1 Tax=Streptomyces sp. NPDC056661 TaxID=3345898 RepID=UPI0036C21841
MRVATVGSSGLRVTRVAMGCAQLGTRVRGSEAIDLVDAAIDAGITFFDTADIYGDGESERLLGSALKGKRDSCVVATKFRHASIHPGASRRSIRLALDSSLARLRTDYVDLYQVHAPDPATPIEETIGALQDLVQRGKILYFGLCNVATWEIVNAHRVAREAHRPGLTSAQLPFNLLDIGRLDEFRRVSQHFGVGLLAASPLGRGLLGGAYDLDRPPPASHPIRRAKGARYWNAEGFATVERVRKLAKDRGVSPAQIALSALLSYPEVSAVLVGATSTEHVRANSCIDPHLLDQADLRYLRGRSDHR